MLNTSHCQAYQQLQVLLEKLKKNLKNDPIELNIIQKIGVEIDEILQNQIVALTSDTLDSNIVPRWRSLSTELHRELRLLKTDLLFLGASRNTATKQMRINAIEERLTKMLSYCQLLLDLIT